MKIINTTPHTVNIFSGDTIVASFPSQSSAFPARVAEKSEAAGSIDGVPVSLVSQDKEATQLPPAVDGTIYLVSRVTAAAAPHREDFFFPHVEVRDENGRILGCRGLGQYA